MSTDKNKVIANWAALHQLAPNRFDAYRRANDTDELDAIARYVWNMEVSKSLHTKLHIVEVTFRNQLNLALNLHYGASWYDNPSVLSPETRLIVGKVKDELTRLGRPLDPGRVVAGLSFGFWTELYGQRYETRIGIKTLRAVFPHYSGTLPLRRSLISGILKDIRLLRNRVAHLEPIIFDPDLPIRHEQMANLISWMNPQMAKLSDIKDNLREVYGGTWKPYRSAIEVTFG
jgi:hypothetical protein